MSKFFKSGEFHRCIPPCNISSVDVNLLYRLDKLRELYGKPIILNSAYRTVEYERSVGRSGTSSHTKGLAVDIRCLDSRERLLLLKSALDVGFRRIGIYKRFLHLDIDSSKPKCVWIV